MNDTPEFDFSSDYRMTCPLCKGRGTVPYTPLSSNPARSSDPDTSQKAASKKQSSDVGRFQTTSQKGRLLTLFVEGEKLTAQGAARKILGSSEVSVIEGARRRVHDLAAVGYLQDSGETSVNVGASTDSIVWIIAPLGKSAYEHMQATGWTR